MVNLFYTFDNSYELLRRGHSEAFGSYFVYVVVEIRGLFDEYVGNVSVYCGHLNEVGRRCAPNIFVAVAIDVRDDAKNPQINLEDE